MELKCGHVRIINGKAWICVKEPHSDPPPTPRTRWDRHGFTPRPPDKRDLERHYYRRRYPGTDH